jgi:hypothetical protein
MASKKKKKQRTHAKKIEQKARRKMHSETDREAEPETDIVATAPAKTSTAETLGANLVSTLKGLLKRGFGKEGEGQPKQAADPESESRTAGIIKVTIIVVTFVSIAALSMFSQGLDGEWPGVGIVVIRFALLSTTAVIYFLMLYMTRQSRRNEDGKAAAVKK